MPNQPQSGSPYAVEGPFSLEPQTYQSTAPKQVSGYGGKTEALAMFADKFLEGFSRGRKQQFDRQEQERAQLRGDYERAAAEIEKAEQSGSVAPDALNKAKGILQGIAIMQVKSDADKSKDKKNPAIKAVHGLFDAMVGPTPKKYEFGPGQIYKGLTDVHNLLNDDSNSTANRIAKAAGDFENMYKAASQAEGRDHPLTAEEIAKHGGMMTKLNYIQQLSAKSKLPIPAGVQEILENAPKPITPEQQASIKEKETAAVRNISAADYDKARADQARRTPPKEDKKTEAERNDELAEKLYRQTHGIKEGVDLDPKQQTAARKEFKESQETDEQKMMRASLEQSRRMGDILKQLQIDQQPTKEQAIDAAKDIIEHRMAPEQMSQMFGGFGTAGQNFKRMVKEQVTKLDPKFDFEKAAAEYTLVKSPQFQNTIRYMDSVTDSIPLVIRRSNELGNSKVRFVNGLANISKQQLSDPTLKKFQTDALLVADEIAKILQGGGTGNGTSDAKLKQAGEIINTADSPQAVSAALADVKELLGYRRKALTRGTYMENTEAGGGTTPPPGGNSQSSTTTPTPAAPSGPKVKMKSPTGVVQEVDASEVDHYKKLGATVVKEPPRKQVIPPGGPPPALPPSGIRVNQ